MHGSQAAELRHGSNDAYEHELRESFHVAGLAFNGNEPETPGRETEGAVDLDAYALGVTGKSPLDEKTVLVREKEEAKQWQHRHETAERSHREAVHSLEARCETLQSQWQNAEKAIARLSGHVAALEMSLANASARPKAKRAPRSARSSKAVKAKTE